MTPYLSASSATEEYRLLLDVSITASQEICQELAMVPLGDGQVLQSPRLPHPVVQEPMDRNTLNSMIRTLVQKYIVKLQEITGLMVTLANISNQHMEWVVSNVYDALPKAATDQLSFPKAKDKIKK
jgi:hypothetical protein